MRRPLLFFVFFVACLLAPLAACSESAGGRGILAGTPVWAEITSVVACGEPVEALVARGADHHAYEPSLADRGRIDAARLVVANGGGVEGGLEDTLDASPTPVHEVHLGDGDPHLWLDPVAVAVALPALAEALVGTGGLHAADVDACRRTLDADLRNLDAELAGRLAAIPEDRRTIVTDHATLGRFAERYALTVLDTVVHSHSSLAEPSAHDLERLADEMREHGVRVVVAEEDGHDDDARRLAEMTGAALVEAPLRLGPAGSPTGTHAGMLRTLVERLVAALEG